MTKFYFRNTTSGLSGLPTGSQSSLSIDNNDDSVTINRLLSTTIGSSQTSKICNTRTSTSSQVAYFTRFVSPVLSSTSISANTWNYAFAVAENNVNANFPCSGDGKSIWVNVYVWNTGNSTVYGTIIDGTSNSDYNETNDAGVESSQFGTFNGSSVSSIPAGCVIVYEAIFKFSQNNTTSRTITFYYDGNTETNTNQDPVSNHASYIETPQALTFAGGNITKSISQTITSNGGSLSRVVGKKKAPATENITIGATVPTRRSTKNRSTTETITISTGGGAPSYIKAKQVAKAPPAETVTISSTVAFKRIKPRTLAQIINIVDSVDYLQHPKKFTAKLVETVMISSMPVRKSSKTRNLLN